MGIAECAVFLYKWLVEILRLERGCSRQNGREERLVDLIADVSKVMQRFEAIVNKVLKLLLQIIKVCEGINPPVNHRKERTQYCMVQSQLDIVGPETNINNVLMIALGKVCLTH